MDPAPETTAAPSAEVDPSDLRTLPGYAAAMQADREAHDLAFLDDVPRFVAGSPCRALDLRTLLLLIHLGNPFLCGGQAEPEHVREFLWLCHPDCRPRDDARLSAFFSSVADLDLDPARADIRRFLDDTFSDAPGGGSSSRARAGDARAAASANPTSFVASWVDLLASEYGWDEGRIVGTPARRGVALTRLYQYKIAISLRRTGRAATESARVLRLIGDWLRADLPGEPVAQPVQP